MMLRIFDFDFDLDLYLDFWSGFWGDKNDSSAKPRQVIIVLFLGNCVENNPCFWTHKGAACYWEQTRRQSYLNTLISSVLRRYLATPHQGIFWIQRSKMNCPCHLLQKRKRDNVEIRHNVVPAVDATLERAARPLPLLSKARILGRRANSNLAIVSQMLQLHVSIWID